MKNLMKLFMLAGLIMTLAACGKNSSGDGGSGSGTNTSGVGTSGTWYNNSGDNQGFGDPVAFKNYYTARSMSANISTNTVVYHVGPYYGGSYSYAQLDFSLNFAFCIGNENIFGNDDYCNYQQGNSTADLGDIVDNGEYKVVTAVSSTTNSFNLATGASGGFFDFDSRAYNANSPIYRKMLNLDNKPTLKVVVSRAYASMSNRGNIPVDLIEYYFSDGSYEGYVLGSDIPMIANPLVIIDGSFNTSGGLNFDVIGELNNIGESSLSNLSANLHRIELNPYTYTYNISNATTLSKN